MDGAGGMECGQSRSQPCGVGEELLDRDGFAGMEAIGDGYPAVPLEYRICGAVVLADGVDAGEVNVLDGGGGPGAVHELGAPCCRCVGVEDPDQHRPVERGVDRQPLLDVAVASEPDLGLVAVGESRGHGSGPGAALSRRQITQQAQRLGQPHVSL